MATIVDGYCRVSTDPQEENTSLDEQEAVIREYCREHGLVIGLIHREVFSGYQYREREKLEAERAQLIGGLVDKEREQAAFLDILVWCKQVKEAREEMTYQRKRDFLNMLGIVVTVRCEKPYREKSKYIMRVALPALQELIGLPSEEDGGPVTPTLVRK